MVTGPDQGFSLLKGSFFHFCLATIWMQQYRTKLDQILGKRLKPNQNTPQQPQVPKHTYVMIVLWHEAWPTSYTATLVVSWEDVCMLLTECERSADFSSRPLLDSLRSSNVIFFGPWPEKHHDGVSKRARLSSAIPSYWWKVFLLTFLLSWGLMNVRSSKVRRIRLGPLTSWICWSRLLSREMQTTINEFTPELPLCSCLLQTYIYSGFRAKQGNCRNEMCLMKSVCFQISPLILQWCIRMCEF